MQSIVVDKFVSLRSYTRKRSFFSEVTVACAKPGILFYYRPVYFKLYCNATQARSHRGAFSPKFCCDRKIWFKHIIKQKSWPIKMYFASPKLKSWLRASRSDGFTHRPWPRAPSSWGPHATHSYDDSMLTKICETAQGNNFTIHLESGRNANVCSRPLSAQ